jgi:hypothetical protein
MLSLVALANRTQAWFEPGPQGAELPVNRPSVP